MPPYPVPAAADNVETVESWSGYALNMHSDKSSRLAYPCVDSAGRPLVTFQTGTLRFWFAPAWSSGEADPTSPQALGRFIEAGQWTADASAGWWSLYLNPDRTAIYFSAHANGQGTDFLKAPIDWRAGEWHLVTLTYSPTATALYIDEALVGQGAGISLVPFPLPLGGEAQGEGAAATFTIGSDAQGQNLAQGFFDDFATFDRAHSAADVVRYNRFTHTFGKTTPVDLASTTLETLQVQFDPSETSLVEVGNGGGLLQLNSPEGGGPNSPLNGGNGLWLEIALITNHAVLTLHGTTPTTNYLFLSRANLTTGAWVPEAFVTGADGQDWTQLVLPIDRPTVFFRAGLGEDTDGDGLPDVYESLVTDTDPNNPDTGDTGTSDGYKDNDGDGWTNLDELNNGTSVNSWDAPPAPLLSAILTLSPQGNNVTLSWETSAGTVSGYEIERVDGFGVHSTLQASPGESSLVDDETRDFDDELLGAPSYLNTYKIRTVYVQGTSQWSAPVPVLKPDTAFNGAIVRGPEGAIYLAVSAIPAVVQSVRLVTRDNTASDPFNAPIHVFEVPVSSIANGLFRFPDAESPYFGGTLFHTHYVMAQGVLTGGRVTQGFQTVQPAALQWPGREELPRRFIDGRAHLKENIDFLLRAATVNEPFEYFSGIDLEPDDFSPWYGRGFVSGDYTFAGFRSYYYQFGDVDTPYMNIFLPWQENTMFRNFALNNADTNSSGLWSTGVGFGTLVPGIRSIANPRFLFNPWDYFGSPAVLPTLLAPSSWQWSYARPSGVTSDPEVGVTRTSSGSMATYSLGSDVRNVFGLRIQSIKLGRTSPATYPVLPAGGSVTTNNISKYFPDVERPVLETVGYYFGQIDDHSFEFPNPRPIDPLPGHANFSPATTTPLFIGAVGKSIEFSAWAKQRIANGNPNKFAYREEYFDKAYRLDTSGNPANETGILSEYGEFFPTEPGRVILTTKPDPDQGGIQGTCLVNVIRLDLDANHDGLMDRTFAGPDNTSAQRPFRFWINNDNDGPLGAGKETRNPDSPDLADDRIRTQRDLEDFARLWISGVPALPSAEGYSVTLEWSQWSGQPKLRLFRAFEPDGGTDYLTDVTVAESIVGIAPNQFNVALGTVSPGTPFVFPENSFALLGRKHLIFEGVAAGRGELKLIISQYGNDAAIDIKYVVNTNASRNLEYVPSVHSQQNLSE